MSTAPVGRVDAAWDRNTPTPWGDIANAGGYQVKGYSAYASRARVRVLLSLIR